MHIGWIQDTLRLTICVTIGATFVVPFLVPFIIKDSHATNLNTENESNSFRTGTNLTNNDASKLFRLGVIHFNNKHYSLAIEHFVAAEQQGMQLAKLHFNLGSAYYKTRQFESALRSFTRSANDPKLETLSKINIALSLFKLSKKDSAATQLRAAFDSTDNNKYRSLIQRIANKHDINLQFKNKFLFLNSGYSVYMGYSDNVRLQDDNNTANTQQKQSSEFGQIALSTNALVSDNVNIRFALRSTNYPQQLSEYNYDQIKIEPQVQMNKQNWHFLLVALYQPARLNSKKYLTTTELRSQLRYQIKPSLQMGLSTSKFKYKHNNATSYLSGASYLSGEANKYGLFFNFQNKRIALSLHASNQAINRPEITNGSFSPKRRKIALKLKTVVSTNQLLGVVAENRVSHYPNNTRDDHRQSINIHYSYKIKSYWLLISLNRIKNVSDNNVVNNVIDYDYTSNIFQLGISSKF